MGMFDYVIINVDKLPISAKDRRRLKNQRDKKFQSKDFDCILTDITITDDRELEIVRFEYGWDEHATNGFGTKGAITHENVRTEKIPLHGDLNFYTIAEDNQEWFEFNAKFKNGKLKKIERLVTPK